jgi:hypothetical protein
VFLEEGDRKQLRLYLNRAQRKKVPYQKLKSVGINLDGLKQFALEILDDPMTTSTCSPASIPESPPYHQHPAYGRQANPPAHKSSANTYGRQPRSSQTSSGDTTFRYEPPERRYHNSRRETTFRYATPDDSMRETRPSPSYGNHDERGRHHIPKQRRSLSPRRRSPSPIRYPDSVYVLYTHRRPYVNSSSRLPETRSRQSQSQSSCSHNSWINANTYYGRK